MTDPIAAARSILARPQHHIMPEERIVATYILAAFPQVAKPSRDAADAEMEPVNFATHGARALVPIGARHILAEPSRDAVAVAEGATLDEQRAEVERLTRERDGARESAHYAGGVADLAMQHRDDAESALAAERKRSKEMERALRWYAEDWRYEYDNDCCFCGVDPERRRSGGIIRKPDTSENGVLADEGERARDALAGGTAGDGEQVTQHQQRGN